MTQAFARNGCVPGTSPDDVALNSWGRVHMRRTSFLVILGVFVLTLVPFAFLAEQAEATLACCRLRADGTIAPGSFRCSKKITQTQRLATGQYEADFTPVSTDIRKLAKSATLNTQTTGSLVAEIGVADRAGDTSSVFIAITNNAGTFIDAGFDVCLHRVQ
ncbi:MAG TPA: hypothetical protein VGD07_17960 [Methylomirabilota bacterium]